MNRVGIDLGGTKIEGVLLDEQNNVLKRERILTERVNGYDAIIGKIVLVAETLINSQMSMALSVFVRPVPLTMPPEC